MNEANKIGAVIVSHGQLANELLSAAELVVGELSHIRAVSIGWHDDVGAAKEEISRAIASVSSGAGVLLLTDMFGGTPTNIAATFLADDDVEVVTGVNLPMVLKVASASSGLSLSEFAREVEDQGKESITMASTLLGSKSLRKDA